MEGATIAINFKLLFLPKECLDYVIVHELAHTLEHSHSQRFWKILGSAMPDYPERKKMLRQNAYQLKQAAQPGL